MDEGVSEAMKEIFQSIEANEDFQFSLDELLEQVSGPIPTIKTIKDRMQEKYNYRIVFSRMGNKKTVVCFRATGEKFLNDMWYSSRSKDPQAKRQRIVRTAAKNNIGGYCIKGL